MDRKREAIISALEDTAAPPRERCAGSLLLFCSAEQRLQPCFGPSGLAAFRRAWLRHGEERRSALEWQEIAKAMTSTTSSKPGNGQA